MTIAAMPSLRSGRSGRIEALDGYRAIAAVAVLATHVGFLTAASVNGRLAPVLSRLDVGVAIFFVLSGFVLFSPFVSSWLGALPRPSTAQYFWHRALRILPLYWVTVVIAAATIHRDGAWSVRETLVQALMLQSWQPGAQVLGLTQMWSLSIEIAFYVVLPLLVWALLRPRRTPAAVLAWLGVLAAASLVCRGMSVAMPEVFGSGASLQLPAHLDWFAAGMALAVFRECHRARVDLPGLMTARILAGLPGWCVVAALGCFALSTTPLGGPRQLAAPTGFENLAKHVLYLGVALFLILPVVLGERSWLSDALAAPLLLQVGAMSYGIFCLHLVVLEALYSVTGLALFSGWLWLVLPVTLVASLLVAAVTRSVVERPASRLRSLHGWG